MDLLFQNISRHVSLSDSEKTIIRNHFKPRTLRKRQFLLQSGDVSRFETFVTKGCLRAYTIDGKGQEHVIMFAVEDWWISDLYSFLTDTPAAMQIDALEDSEVLVIEKNDLETLYRMVPALERFFRIKFQNAFVSQQRRILGAMSQSAEERYLNFVRQYPALEQRIPQHQVASFLGLTPETISRIRAKLSGSLS